MAGGTDFEVPDLAVAGSEDLRLLFIAALAGVVLATLPVAWGMRKRPGLILS
jgi:hypothetical protein